MQFLVFSLGGDLRLLLKNKLKALKLYIVISYFRILSKILNLFATNKQRKPKSILILAAFFEENAGYHWRVEKWAKILKQEGYNVKIAAASTKDFFYQNHNSNLTNFIIEFTKKRFWQVWESRKYEIVIVRRELLLYNDYGNLFLEKFLLKIHPNAILDFDDDIAYAKNEPREVKSLFGKLAGEHPHKFTASLSLYRKFTVGSNYLQEYVLKKNKSISKNDVLVLPTCVDYSKIRPKDYSKLDEDIIFGWIGGDHNQHLLTNLIPALNKVHSQRKIRLKVISRTPFQDDKATFPIENEEWSLNQETNQLKSITIGLMPLNNTDEDKGKAGFKLIQYMGLGIVSIANGITVNNEIVDDKINGFLVPAETNWEPYLMDVINQLESFPKIGSEARSKIEKHYTFNSNKNRYLAFLKKHFS